MKEKSVKFIFKKETIGYRLITEICLDGDLVDKSSVTKMTKQGIIDTACCGVLYYFVKWGHYFNVSFRYYNIKKIDKFKSKLKDILNNDFFLDIDV